MKLKKLLEKSLPKKLKDNPQLTCVIGLNTEPERLADIRKNRMNSLRETENKKYYFGIIFFLAQSAKYFCSFPIAIIESSSK